MREAQPAHSRFVTARARRRFSSLAGVLAAGLVAAFLSVGSAAVAAPGDEATITGRLSEGSDPVRGVIVAAHSWDKAGGSYTFEQNAVTRSDGRWTLNHLPDGDYTLEFDTSRSSARFALGESLGGNAKFTADDPQFSIVDGRATTQPFSDVTLGRLGGAVELSVTGADGAVLIDLDDAYGTVAGLTRSGNAWASTRTWSDETGRIFIARVPVGGYTPAVGAAGSAPASLAGGILVRKGAVTVLGNRALPAPVSGTLTAVSGQVGIDGTPQVGVALAAALPSFSATPELVEYQWMANSRPVSGATDASFSPTAAEVGKKLTLWVYAHSSGLTSFVGVTDPSAAVLAIDDPTPAPVPSDTPTSSPAPTPSETPTSSSTPAPGTTGAGSGTTDDGDTADAAGLAITGVAPYLAIVSAVALLAVGTVMVIRRRKRDMAPIED